MQLTVTANATCTNCGCVCDDIELRSNDERIVEAREACSLGQSWFFSHTSKKRHPEALIDGQAAPLGLALETAAKLLREARYPLVYGLGTVSCEAQRAAVELAESLGGALDTHTSQTHGVNKIAAQLMGKISCTLGEVRNRADLVLYWGSNPVESHPRHHTRYSLTPTGKFIPTGREGRELIVVDVRPTPTTELADEFIPIRPGSDFEMLTALRAVLRDRRVNPELVAACGVTIPQLKQLANRMKSAKYGVIFFGSGLTGTRGKHMNVAAILALVRELNGFTKFAAMPMRDHGNESGSDNVLSWTASYPFAIDFSRGYPRYNPGEFTAVDLLVRRDVDAALIVGADPAASMPQAAIDHLARIPTVVIDPRITATSRLARVHLTTSASGISTTGTAYRMDKVPMPLKAVLRSPYSNDIEILNRLRDLV